MKCFLCGGKGVIKQQKGRDVCSRCFSNMISKRVRKFIRLEKLFSKNDKILVIGEVNKFLLSEILAKMQCKVKYLKQISEVSKFDKVVIEWTLDDEINSFFTSVVSGKKSSKLSKKYVKLLKVVTDSEVLLFAKYNKLKFKENKKDSVVQKFLDSIEEKHPNIKYNLVNNVQELNKLNVK